MINPGRQEENCFVSMPLSTALGVLLLANLARCTPPLAAELLLAWVESDLSLWYCLRL